MTESVEDIRAWAKKCADVTRNRVAEFRAWDQIAERGQEWDLARRKDGKPYRGGPMMTSGYCFWNAARVAAGETAFNPAGCKYAEGFALSSRVGLWFHHAWVVNAAGLVIDRTWQAPADRYVGVTFDEVIWEPGDCQLDEWALGTVIGPHYAENPEVIDRMWGGATVLV
jgi:hypothetical protein